MSMFQVFDSILNDDFWKVFEGYGYCRERLRERVVKRAIDKGISPEQFQKELKQEASEWLQAAASNPL